MFQHYIWQLSRRLCQESGSFRNPQNLIEEEGGEEERQENKRIDCLLDSFNTGEREKEGA